MLDIKPISSEAPRIAYRSGACWFLLMFIPGMLTFLLLVILLVGIPRLIEANRLNERGIEAIAQVTDLTVSNGRGGPSHHVLYDYTVLGHTYHKDEIVPEEYWLELAHQTNLLILYDPTKPYESVGKAWSAWPRGQYANALTVAPLICGLLSIAIIFIVEFIYRGERALLERGNIATAIILNEKIFASRGRRYSKLTYEFSLQDERRFRGTRSYVPIKEASSPEDIAWRAVYVDTPTVLYDADNPRKNALYPMMWAKLRA